MTDLPPYTGDNPTCTKCGNVGAYTRHRGGHDYDALVRREHLERQCSNCGYGWAEATIEQKPATEPDRQAAP